MGLATVLIDSFSLLRDRPLLFLPKLAVTLIWSLYWIVLIKMVVDPVSMTLRSLTLLFSALLITLPFRIWVMNIYFFIVQQHEQDSIDMIQATRDGFYRVPAGLAAFTAVLIVSITALLPGAILTAHGIATQQMVTAGVGIILGLVTLLTVFAFAYFIPVSVVIGDSSFLQNIWKGLQTSTENRMTVFAITLLSFALLIVTVAMGGTLSSIGIAGFLISRLAKSVISVYTLIINPELLLELQDDI
jgi:hypothetical protein